MIVVVKDQSFGLEGYLSGEQNTWWFRRPDVASWAELEVTLVADLLAGDQDPRPGAPGLLRRALRGLPVGVGKVKMRTDC